MPLSYRNGSRRFVESKSQTVSGMTLDHGRIRSSGWKWTRHSEPSAAVKLTSMRQVET